MILHIIRISDIIPSMQKSGEDYLEAILRLSEETGKDAVRTTDIANKLGVSKPSVSRAMSILKDDGFIEQETYGDIFLTEKGNRAASEVYDRHKKLTVFFRDILGVEATLAEHDACLIEHDISKESMQKLTDFVRRYQEEHSL